MPSTHSASKPVGDILLVALLPVATFVIGAGTEFSEQLMTGAQRFERLQLDELPLALVAFSLGLAWFAWRRWREMLRELDKRRDIEAALEAKQIELRNLSRRVTESQEVERRAIAHELHDELGQTLNAIKVESVCIRNESADRDSTIHTAALSIIRLTDQVYSVVRDMTGRLRPVALDELGLAEALEHDLAEWRQRLPEIKFDFTADTLPEKLGDPCAIALYRIAQEGMTNVVRHAEAHNVSLALTFHRESAVVSLSLRDDGRGVELHTMRSGLGLLGMRERVEALGGAFRIESQPARGFRIEASVPFDVGADAVGVP